jgi:PKD repeat protein
MYGAGWAVDHAGCGTVVSNAANCVVGSQTVLNGYTYCDGDNQFLCQNGEFIYQKSCLASSAIISQCKVNGVTINKGETACVNGMLYYCERTATGVNPYTTEAGNCTGSGTIWEPVVAPICYYNIDPVEPKPGETVTFTPHDCTGTTPTRSVWNFGDGSTEIVTTTPSKVTHIYTVAGTYKVSLLVTVEGYGNATETTFYVVADNTGSSGQCAAFGECPPGDINSPECCNYTYRYKCRKSMISDYYSWNDTGVRCSGDCTGGLCGDTTSSVSILYPINTSGRVVVTSNKVITTSSKITWSSGSACTTVTCPYPNVCVSGVCVITKAATSCDGLERDGEIDPSCMLETGNELYLYGAIGLVALLLLSRRK